MNRVELIGNLTKDPEIRGADTKVASFTLAVSRKDGKADFPRITCFGKTAEIAERYLKKGSKVAIEGSIRTGSYQDRAGKTVYTTDVNADRVEFLNTREEEDGWE